MVGGFAHLEVDGTNYKGVEGEGFKGTYTRDELSSAPAYSGTNWGDSSTSSSIKTAAGSQAEDDYSYYLANSEKTSDDAENVSIREISRYLERYG